jgi:hypothetical protein
MQLKLPYSGHAPQSLWGMATPQISGATDGCRAEAPRRSHPPFSDWHGAKNHIMAQGLNAGMWMKGLQRIATSEQIEQFITLWSLTAQVQRTTEPDKITWCLTTKGVYTSKSAYHAGFIGSYADYEWNRVSKAKVEHKCMFFTWLLLQNKLWTANQITRQGGQINQICQLCKTQPETAFHIMADCSFSRVVWLQLQD